MKTRIVVIISLALGGFNLLAAAPAQACDRYPCQTTCKVNPPSVDPWTIDVPQHLIECYY